MTVTALAALAALAAHARPARAQTVACPPGTDCARRYYRPPPPRPPPPARPDTLPLRLAFGAHAGAASSFRPAPVLAGSLGELSLALGWVATPWLLVEARGAWLSLPRRGIDADLDGRRDDAPEDLTALHASLLGTLRFARYDGDDEREGVYLSAGGGWLGPLDSATGHAGGPTLDAAVGVSAGWVADRLGLDASLEARVRAGLGPVADYRSLTLGLALGVEGGMQHKRGEHHPPLGWTLALDTGFAGFPSSGAVNGSRALLGPAGALAGLSFGIAPAGPLEFLVRGAAIARAPIRSGDAWLDAAIAEGAVRVRWGWLFVEATGGAAMPSGTLVDRVPATALVGGALGARFTGGPVRERSDSVANYVTFAVRGRAGVGDPTLSHIALEAGYEFERLGRPAPAFPWDHSFESARWAATALPLAIGASASAGWFAPVRGLPLEGTYTELALTASYLRTDWLAFDARVAYGSADARSRDADGDGRDDLHAASLPALVATVGPRFVLAYDRGRSREGWSLALGVGTLVPLGDAPALPAGGVVEAAVAREVGLITRERDALTLALEVRARTGLGALGDVHTVTLGARVGWSGEVHGRPMPLRDDGLGWVPGHTLGGDVELAGFTDGGRSAGGQPYFDGVGGGAGLRAGLVMTQGFELASRLGYFRRPGHGAVDPLDAVTFESGPRFRRGFFALEPLFGIAGVLGTHRDAIGVQPYVGAAIQARMALGDPHSIAFIGAFVRFGVEAERAIDQVGLSVGFEYEGGRKLATGPSPLR